MDLEASAHKEESEELPAQSTAEAWWAAWCTIGAFCGLFATMGFLYCVGCFRFIYQHMLLPNHTPFQLSWIFAVQRACFFAFPPLFGRLVDMYGPKVVIWPLAGICAFETFAISLPLDYWQLMLSQGVFFEMAAGGIYTACLISMGQWFEQRRGLAAGIAACGSSLGGIAIPVFLAWVMEEAKLEDAMQYTSILVGIVLIPSLFLVRERLPVRGFPMELSFLRDWIISDDVCTPWGYWAPIDYLTQSALDYGLPPTFALYLIPIVSAASIPGNVIFGHLGDRLGHLLILTHCAKAIVTSFVFLWIPFSLVRSAFGLFVFALVYGYLGGAFMSLLMPCVANYGSVETTGQRFGSFQFIMAISCLTGLPITEAIRTLSRSYLGMQMFASLSLFFGTIFLLFSLDILTRALAMTMHNLEPTAPNDILSV